MTTVLDALDDPDLFGPWFLGPSWATWRAVLKGAFGLPMTRRERELFRTVADREPPKKRVKELWIIAGRRAGKDSIASAIAAWFGGFVDYEGKLRPGEAAAVMCLAVDKEQAKIVLRYTKAYFERLELLRDLVTREHKDGLELSTGAELTILASNFRNVRGRTIACVILDECAYWRDEMSANPDAEVYAALRPGMVSISDSMLIGISTPYRRAGLLYEKYRDHYGKDDDNVLVIQAPSRALNPTIPQSEVDDAMSKDAASAKAEYLAEWRDDVAAFLPLQLIEGAVDKDVSVRPPVPGVKYHAFIDVSGGVSDSYTLAIAHSESDSVLLDVLSEIKPPFNPTSATAELAATVKGYRLNSVTGDRYGQAWVVDAWAKNGIRLEHSDRDRSAIYGDAIPLFSAGRARLLDLKKLRKQLAGLERRVMPGGKDRIDHPGRQGAHDDLANSACGALVLASSKTGPLKVSAGLLERSRNTNRESAQSRWLTRRGSFHSFGPFN